MARTLYQGKSTPAATVTVYWAGTTTKPTIYVNGLAGAAKSNPITADADGSYSFWAEEGHYKIVNGTIVAGVAADLTDVRFEFPENVTRAKDVTLLPFLGNPAGNLETWYEGAVAGPITTAGVISTTDATQSSSITTGSIITTGGVGIGKAVFVGGLLNVAGQVSAAATTTSGSITTGALVTAGGAGIAKTLYVGETGNFAGQLSAAASTASTTPLTGSFVTAGGIGVVGASTFGSAVSLQTANLGNMVWGYLTEEVTLSTAGTTTDSTANLLPAGAIIDAVIGNVTTTITTATNWKLGDPASAGRFSAVNSVMTAGSSSIGLLHMAGDVATVALGPTQAAAAKIRITTTGTPGAGKIRLTTYFHSFVAPSS